MYQAFSKSKNLRINLDLDLDLDNVLVGFNNEY